MKTLAQKLRRQATPSEKLLWQCLRKNQRLGYSFRRQQPIDSYIVDFCCLEKRLVIEIDGEVHSHSKIIERDTRREEYLRYQGFQVVRFSVDEVMSNLEGVVCVIDAVLGGAPPP